jgi:hypothetical protein
MQPRLWLVTARTAEVYSRTPWDRTRTGGDAQPDDSFVDQVPVSRYWPTHRAAMQDLDPSLYGEADRRAVDPPIEVEAATWSAGGQLDWWVKERQQWLGRVRGPDSRQRWIRAVDLRPASEPTAMTCRCHSCSLVTVGQLCRPDVQDGGVWTRPGKSCRVGGKPIHSRTR